MKRREFLKASLTVSTLTGASMASLSTMAASPSGKQEYYELRAYHLKSPDKRSLLDAYLEHAAIPAWNRLGVKPVGVFVQQERPGTLTKTEVRDPATIFVLLPYASLEVFAKVTARMCVDSEYQKAGADYLQVTKDSPVFDRIDSWLMLAFAGMPKLNLPAYSKEGKPRMFELRTYESRSEVKALNKVQMFNSGEIDTMHEVGLGPIFYGQALIGPNLPHLTYMVSAENQEAHSKHWGAFGAHPTWKKLKEDPQYADNVSKIYNRFLVPAPYSQI